VATALVPPSLRDHLGLDPGFGIQVHEVVPETPAATAGLMRHDILVKLDDQLLISPEHLSLLIGIHMPGDTVELHFIRKGEQKTIDVTLVKLDPAKWPQQFRTDALSAAPNGPPSFGNWQDQMRKQQEHWQKWSEKQDGALNSKDATEDSAASPSSRGHSEFPITVFGKEGVINIDNPEGFLRMKTEGGETQITIRDASDELVYEGVFDPDAGIESLPEEAQEQLKRMKLQNLPRLTLPAKPPRKISSPMPPMPAPSVL
jgi:hypothetical protein